MTTEQEIRRILCHVYLTVNVLVFVLRRMVVFNFTHVSTNGKENYDSINYSLAIVYRLVVYWCSVVNAENVFVKMQITEF